MNINRYLSNNFPLQFLLGGIVATLGFVIVVGAFFLGAQWRLSRSALDLPPAFVFGTPSQAQVGNQSSPTSDASVPGSITPSATDSALNETIEPTLTQTNTTLLLSTATVTPIFIPGNSVQPADLAKLLDSNPGNWTYLGPKSVFYKSMTIKNIGSTTWTKDYDLVFVSGTGMTENRIFSLPEKVKPGQSVEFSMKLLTPKTPGAYEGYWMLRNSYGELFGIGPGADQAFAVKIIVLNVDPNSRYDFILNRCNATWWNGNVEPVHCPGEPVQSTGFVLLDPLPMLENGSSEKPILWVHPDNRIEGILSGKYPPITIKEGDHFRAKVGCIGGYAKCNVTFKLLYQIGDNPNQSLGSWKELYGGGISTIDVDLSHLAGEKVKFILRVMCGNNTPSAAQGFWMTPRIVYVKPASTTTPVPTLTATATPTDTPTPSETPTPTETPLVE